MSLCGATTRCVWCVGLLAVVLVGVVVGGVLGALMLFTIAVCLRKYVTHSLHQSLLLALSTQTLTTPRGRKKRTDFLLRASLLILDRNW